MFSLWLITSLKNRTGFFHKLSQDYKQHRASSKALLLNSSKRHTTSPSAPEMIVHLITKCTVSREIPAFSGINGITSTKRSWGAMMSTKALRTLRIRSKNQQWFLDSGEFAVFESYLISHIVVSSDIIWIHKITCFIWTRVSLPLSRYSYTYVP